MRWHAIYTEDGKVKDIYFIAPPILESAERWFSVLRPKATYVEIGMLVTDAKG